MNAAAAGTRRLIRLRVGGGADAADAEGVHSVERDPDAWRVEVGSGTYRFVDRAPPVRTPAAG